MNPSSTSMLITGAGQRIGALLAHHFVARGWEVVVHFSQSAEAAQALVAALKAQGGEVYGVQGDLCNPQEREQMMQQAQGQVHRPLGVLINNAAVFQPDGLETLTAENWQRHMAVNAEAPTLLIQSFVNHLQGAQGHVINILDQRVLKPTKFLLSYTASKFALLGVTQVLARALAPQVRVNALAPGLILPSSQSWDAQFATRQAALPLATPPTVAHLARALEFLLETPSITGHILPVDGGENL